MKMVMLQITKFQKPLNGRKRNSKMKKKKNMNYQNTRMITGLTQMSTTGVIMNSSTTGTLHYMIVKSWKPFIATRIQLSKPDTPDHIT